MSSTTTRINGCRLGISWTVLARIAFFLAGSAICSGIPNVPAARLLALLLLLFEALVEISPVFMRPHNQVAWGGAVYNLAAMVACWIFVECVESHGQADRGKAGLVERYVVARESAFAWNCHLHGA